MTNKIFRSTVFVAVVVLLCSLGIVMGVLYNHFTGVQVEQLATWEGLCEVAHAYYDWTDAQTEAPHDGKAFFGRDAFANYMLIGSLQLGVEMFQVEQGEMTLHIDEAVMRRLWDNYVVPYASGHYGAYGRFRSDDVKTGQLVALVGSTSGVSAGLAATDPDLVPYGTMVATFYSGTGCLLCPSLLYGIINLLF